jgi:hypothetical protein
MSDRESNIDRLFDLAGAVCDGVASPNDLVELDSMISADHMTRCRYMDYCRIHVALRLELHAQSATQKVDELIDNDPVLPVPGDVVNVKPQAAIPFGPLDGTLQGATGHFFSGWPAAYLVATVLCGLGLLIGSLMPVSHSPKVATRLPAIRSNKSMPEPQVDIVGRITGMVDCRWSNPNTAVSGPVPVSLGRKYALASGLMEITYNNGAKVILQGPCRYEVESAAGGFLSLGKLTAKVEKGKAVRSTEYGVRSAGEIDTAENQKSELINHKLFSVRTPTATVTDLGTEFGVVVEDGRRTEVHCFRGLVEVQRDNGAGGALGETIRLAANEGVHFNYDSAPADRMAAEPTRFVRTSSDDKSGLIARYPFDKISGGSLLQTPDSSGHHRSGILQRMTQANLVPGKVGQALAFNVEDGRLDQCVTVRWSPPLDVAGKSFAIAFWLNRQAEGTEPHELILHKENGREGEAGGYAILRDRQSGRIVFRAHSSANAPMTVAAESSGDDAPQGVWVHCAVVGEFDPAENSYRVVLYHNGVCVAERLKVTLSPTYRPLVIAAADYGGDWAFRGLLDDLQIYRRALSQAEIKFLFEHPGELPATTDNNPERR